MPEELREKASDLAETAKQQARQQYDSRIGSAIREIDCLASALRRAGDEVSSNGSSVTARVANGVADKLETFSGSLSGKSLDEVVEDVESFARRNTAAFLGGAALIGFAAARFLKSSSRGDFENGDTQYGSTRYGGRS